MAYRRGSSSDRMIVRPSCSARHCSDLWKESRSVQELCVQRRRLDAVLTGTLQDILQSQDSWKKVEWNGSSQLSLRLLESLSDKKVDTIVLVEPSPDLLALLAQQLQRGLLGVQRLVLRSALVSPPVARHLSKHSFLQLELCDSALEEGAMTLLAQGMAQQGQLETLCFRGCHLEDSEVSCLVQALQDHPSLSHLDLSVNFCQAEGTEAIANLLMSPTTPLLQLQLACQDVWDSRDYFIHLATALSHPNCTLQRLNLSSNFLNDDHFVWLVLALRDNQHLEQLELHDNQISNVGLMTFAKNLSTLSSLRRLSLSKNRYTRQGVAMVIDALQHNVYMRELELDTEDEISTCQLQYLLILNQAGRYCKMAKVPLGLWPHILEQASHKLEGNESIPVSFSSMDILFDLLHGPALFDH